ncbi:MAG: undecaprenyldiphospho-muramoylpentapeptide beta-N-acetylglucosaminyltransferase [Bacteroidales bacterium]
MNKKIIISGGGTGGHIFPALAIANAIQQIAPSTEFLFVGAEGRMEMEKVPAAGYRIIGLPIIGFNRQLFSIKNLKFPFQLLKSLWKASKIIRQFCPDVVLGVGGYASAPMLWMAQNKGIPTLIQEQNSYAGLTNKFLAKRAKKICVAYENMERFFPKKRIAFTGNPVRKDLQYVNNLRTEASIYFGLEEDRKTLLILGGSLGARTLNQSVLKHLALLVEQKKLQILWQVGALYEQSIAQKMQAYPHAQNIKTLSFIKRMDYAFAAADLVISRAGAGTIAELCIVQKPVILVPSPNVAEDHQTANALVLVNKRAAKLVVDKEAEEKLLPLALQTITNDRELKDLSANIAPLAKLDADREIAMYALQLANKKCCK